MTATRTTSPYQLHAYCMPTRPHSPRPAASIRKKKLQISVDPLAYEFTTFHRAIFNYNLLRSYILSRLTRCKSYDFCEIFRFARKKNCAVLKIVLRAIVLCKRRGKEEEEKSFSSKGEMLMNINIV